MEVVLPGLFRLALGMVNAYLIEDEYGVTLIDGGDSTHAATVMRAITSRGHDLAHVRFVLTHLHYDHAGSAAMLQQHGAPAALMHPLDGADAAQGIQMRKFVLSWPFSMVQKQFDARPLTRGQPIAVDACAHDGVAITPSLHVIHTPGHTAGHISLLWQAHGGVLIAGDACTNVFGLRPAVGHEDPLLAKITRHTLAQHAYHHLVVGHGNPIIGDASQRVAHAFAD